MDESTPREKLLKKVRDALIEKADSHYPDVDFASEIYSEVTESLDVAFAQEFTRIAGKFVFCANGRELRDSISALVLERGWDKISCFEPDIVQFLTKIGIAVNSDEKRMMDVQVGISGCEYLIARLGSVMVSSKQGSGRRLFVYPEMHIVVAGTSKLVPDLSHALSGIRDRYKEELPSLISVIAGPSRTADIEKTLVMGAHGPKELFVFLVDEEENERN